MKTNQQASRQGTSMKTTLKSASFSSALLRHLLAVAVAGYGRRVGICMVMVRRARLRAVAPGMGLAPAR